MESLLRLRPLKPWPLVKFPLQYFNPLLEDKSYAGVTLQIRVLIHQKVDVSISNGDLKVCSVFDQISS